MGQADLIDERVWRRIAYYERASLVADYVRRNYRKPICLESAARVACMERTAFSRFFKQRTGVTFSRFLCAYRLAVAVRLMSKHDAALSRVAEMTGFRSLATLERAFKRVTGLTPTAYRRGLLRQVGIEQSN